MFNAFYSESVSENQAEKDKNFINTLNNMFKPRNIQTLEYEALNKSKNQVTY